jgi:hypothetical protein
MLRLLLAVPRHTRGHLRYLLISRRDSRMFPGHVATHPGYARHLGRRRAVLIVPRDSARSR